MYLEIDPKRNINENERHSKVLIANKRLLRTGDYRLVLCDNHEGLPDEVLPFVFADNETQ
jgi:hypothetical protein